ncbi:MAG: hypothetical protein QHC40_14895 [Sphingobium sp.]|nr:hypothetical protein [Sphingobium sp.]
MTSLFIEIIGWIGALLVLGAYVGVSAGRLSGGSAAFQAMNALGAAFFVLNTWWHGAWPSMVLNIIWSAIGFVALAGMARRARRNRGRGDGQP